MAHITHMPRVHTHTHTHTTTTTTTTTTTPHHTLLGTRRTRSPPSPPQPSYCPLLMRPLVKFTDDPSPLGQTMSTSPLDFGIQYHC